MLSDGTWAPVDFFDLRKDDIVMVVTVVKDDAPRREDAREGEVPVMKVGMTDRNTWVARWTPIEDERPEAPDEDG